MIQNADWICPPVDTGEVCPVFSKNISIDKSVRSALLSVTAALQISYDDGSEQSIVADNSWTVGASR